MGALGVALLIEPTLVDGGLPEQFARLAVEAEDGLDFAVRLSRCQNHLIADDDGRTVAPSGQRAFPEHVFRIAPFERRFLFGVRDAVALGTAPPRPIRRRDDG